MALVMAALSCVAGLRSMTTAFGASRLARRRQWPTLQAARLAVLLAAATPAVSLAGWMLNITLGTRLRSGLLSTMRHAARLVSDPGLRMVPTFCWLSLCGNRLCALALCRTRAATLALARKVRIFCFGTSGITVFNRFDTTHSRAGGWRLAAPLRLSAPTGFSTRSPCCRRPAFGRLAAAVGVHH